MQPTTGKIAVKAFFYDLLLPISIAGYKTIISLSSPYFPNRAIIKHVLAPHLLKKRKVVRL